MPKRSRHKSKSSAPQKANRFASADDYVVILPNVAEGKLAHGFRKIKNRLAGAN